MVEAVTSIVGSAAFAVLLKVPKRLLLFAVLGGAISTLVYMYLDYLHYGTFLSTFGAMVAIGIFSEIIARIKKTPSTVIILPSSVPLLPGSYIYYAMSNIVIYNQKKFLFYALETAKVSMGMALGVLIVGIFVQIIKSVLNKDKY